MSEGYFINEGETMYFPKGVKPLNNRARDTQFANFADALYMECTMIYQEASIRGCIDADQRVIRNIARRAYDLVKHTIEQTEHINLDRLDPDEHAQRIPDLTELPKEEE